MLKTFQPIHLRIAASFGVALLVVATGWVGAGTLTSAMEMRAQLQHARDVIDAGDKVYRNVIEIESAQRGYLLTMSPSYLGPYDLAMNVTDPVAPLRALVHKDHGLAQELDALASDVAHKRGEVAETLEIARTTGSAAAIARVNDNQGKHLMDRIRMRLATIQGEELRAADAQEHNVQRTLIVARIVVLGGTLLAFALAVLVNTSLIRAVRERDAVQATVADQTVKLQSYTESLILHERQLGEQLVKQRELGTALKSSNEALEQFAYATSHDLRAPLRGIMNLASWVEEDLGSTASDAVKQNLGLLRGRARRLDALIEGILAYSRAGLVREKSAQVDTHALLVEVIELIAPPDGVHIELAANLPALYTERVPLQQVLMNLLQNAIKHGCPDGKGTIEVSAEEHGGTWSFSITDHGPGIAEQYHARIFGIFQMLAGRDQVEGTGIGLAVVKKLVESRGGRIMVHSSVGTGARFELTWPIHSITNSSDEPHSA